MIGFLAVCRESSHVDDGVATLAELTVPDAAPAETLRPRRSSR